MKINIFRGRGVTGQARLGSFSKNHHLQCNNSTHSQAPVPFFPIINLKFILILILLILTIVYFCPTTSALGVRPAKTNIIFQPGETKTIGFKIVNTDAKKFEVEISLEGELANYVKLKKEKIHFKADEEIKEVKKVIKLPKMMPPGTIVGELLVTEMIKVKDSPKVFFGDDEIMTVEEKIESGIMAKVAIKHKIIIEVPRQEKYVEAKIEYREQNEDTDMITEVKNLGLEDIHKLNTELAVYENENRIAEFESGEIGLKSLDSKKFYSKISKEKANLGIYDLKSIISFDEKEVEITRQMILGSPLIEILAFDKFFKEKAINDFKIDLENKWNKKIENIYAVIELTKNNKNLIEPTRTTSIDIDARARKTLDSYIDLTNVEKGEYMCIVTLNYEDKKEEQIQKINVLTEKEYNKEPVLVLIIMLTLIIILMLALLIVFIIYLKKKKTGIS